MATTTDLWERLKAFDIERLARLRPNYPPVAVEVEPGGMVLTRLKPARRGAPKLETHKIRDLDLADLTGNLRRASARREESLGNEFARLFQQAGLKPGRVALVLPDDLARTSIVSLPDRPATPRHLEEVLKFKVKRSIPFRIEDARLSYQVLEEPHGGLRVLVSLMRRTVVEHYERALDRAGARVGLIDLCTTNLLNLFREPLTRDGGDAALLNVTPHYFTLVIVHDDRVVFFRTKPFHLGEEATAEPVAPELAERILGRELNASLGYYVDKLDGQGLSRLCVRTTGLPFDAIRARAEALDLHDVRPLDPTPHLELGPGLRLEAGVGQRLAPALGGAMGRG